MIYLSEIVRYFIYFFPSIITGTQTQNSLILLLPFNVCFNSDKLNEITILNGYLWGLF